MSDEDKQGTLSRRSMLMKVGILLNGAVAVALTAPIVRYLLGPVRRKDGYNSWIRLGDVAAFPSGETRLATFVNPSTHSSDGQTASAACWVRRVEDNHFQVFAINCAHLGCPVRWFPQSELFMCPCHGGVYYADGSRASGPPERGLFEYEYRVGNGQLLIRAGQMPTLATQNNLVKGISPCAG